MEAFAALPLREDKRAQNRQVEKMVAALNHAISIGLDGNALLKVVEECNTEGAIRHILKGEGFLLGHAVLLAEILAPLLGIGQGKRKLFDFVVEKVAIAHGWEVKRCVSRHQLLK